MKRDLEIQKNVSEELLWEPTIEASEIGVIVTNGIVTLTGNVDTYAGKKQAERAAQRVSGVKGVVEEIVVNLLDTCQKPDKEIVQAVSNILKWHSSVKEDKIKITVESGWVTIEGEVDWNYEKDAIKFAIEDLIGVKGIHNLIRLNSKMAANDIRLKIADAFKRNAMIDANNINIQVRGQKVTLKGIVRSHAEKQDAEQATFKAPGVTEVNNQLVIKVPDFALL